MKIRLISRLLLLSAITASGVLATGCGNSAVTESETELTFESVSAEVTLPEEIAITNVKVDKEMGVSSINEAVINSESIAANIIGDSSERTIYIYLPESYTAGGKALPVVYFLHGYGDNSKQFALRVQRELDEAFDGSVDEFIMVILDGNNKTGGSFYVNSPSSGNWEDYVTKEVVSYVDANYNTIADSNSRCITGYSMGGYGALNIAINHTDIFSSLLVFCPGIYADGEIDAMWQSWTGWTDVKRSYAQAFSPNTDKESHFGNIPTFSGTDEDNEIIAQWDSGYGCWKKKLDAYIEAGAGLKGIQLDYGTNDQFTWISQGCVFVSDLLSERGITCELNEFKGGHVVPNNAMEDYLIPFTVKYLAFE